MNDVRPEDREKAIERLIYMRLGCDVARRAVEGVESLGWRPGGVSARPDREALATAISEADPEGRFGPQTLADALLAVEHLWTQPATEDEARIRDDERAALFAELTTGIAFDGDTDRTIKAAFSRREKVSPVVWVRERPVPSVPVADPEALAKAIYLSDNWGDPNAEKKWHALEVPLYEDERVRRRAQFLLASGVVQDRATVEREAAAKALDAWADELDARAGALLGLRVVRTAKAEGVRARAAEYREGRR